MESIKKKENLANNKRHAQKKQIKSKHNKKKTNPCVKRLFITVERELSHMLR